MTRKAYVTMTDKFMSGWGMADGKINKLIFECDSIQEAHIVADNAENRDDMKYINVTYNKPYYAPGRYYAQTKTKEEYKAWYQPGYFNKN
jgi:hypothetical protein